MEPITGGREGIGGGYGRSFAARDGSGMERNREVQQQGYGGWRGVQGGSREAVDLRGRGG